MRSVKGPEYLHRSVKGDLTLFADSKDVFECYKTHLPVTVAMQYTCSVTKSATGTHLDGENARFRFDNRRIPLRDSRKEFECPDCLWTGFPECSVGRLCPRCVGCHEHPKVTTLPFCRVSLRAAGRRSILCNAYVFLPGPDLALLRPLLGLPSNEPLERASPWSKRLC